MLLAVTSSSIVYDFVHPLEYSVLTSEKNGVLGRMKLSARSSHGSLKFRVVAQTLVALSEAVAVMVTVYDASKFEGVLAFFIIKMLPPRVATPAMMESAVQVYVRVHAIGSTVNKGLIYKPVVSCEALKSYVYDVSQVVMVITQAGA